MGSTPLELVAEPSCLWTHQPHDDLVNLAYHRQLEEVVLETIFGLDSGKASGDHEFDLTDELMVYNLLHIVFTGSRGACRGP